MALPGRGAWGMFSMITPRAGAFTATPGLPVTPLCLWEGLLGPTSKINKSWITGFCWRKQGKAFQSLLKAFPQQRVSGLSGFRHQELLYLRLLFWTFSPVMRTHICGWVFVFLCNQNNSSFLTAEIWDHRMKTWVDVKRSCRATHSLITIATRELPSYKCM